MIKVTMNLTESDVKNAKVIHEWTGARSKAQAVSIALSLTRFLVDQILKNPEVQFIVRRADGDTERLIMTELENVRNRAEHSKR